MSMPAEHLKPAMNLATLLDGLADAPSLPISGIAADSRRVRPGYLFVATSGLSSHGLDYLDAALTAGAAAVAFDPATAAMPSTAIPAVPVSGLDRHLGTIANRCFDTPSKRLRVSGVTGTNGKTTVALLLRQCLRQLDLRCGYIGTLGSGLDEFDAGSMTTPACIELHSTLADFADDGATDATMEVSSHALEQGRVDGMHFDSAIFTNLSRDHIDYHGSMRAYGEAKARLFLEYAPAHSIVSLDSEFGQELADRIGPNAITLSTSMDRVANGKRHVFARGIVAGPAGSRVSVTSSWGVGEFHLPLPGEFNVANALAVLAALLCRDVPIEKAMELLGRVSAPPGRMQRVPTAARDLPLTYIDYAHTPASLELALRALRSHCSGRLWCVFGCGGERDRGKRSMMGRIAVRLADEVIVTNDNPRSEAPGAIIADILVDDAGGATVIEDRAAAIAHAVRSAAADDLVLIAGKGHEPIQIIGGQRLPFSDYDVALGNLEARAADGERAQ